MAAKLYIGNKCYSSWSLRPWILLKHFGVPFEEVLVQVSGKGVHGGLHKNYSPTGLVPCYHEGDLIIPDSMAISEYFAETHPAMWPSDRTARAVARAVALEMHSGFADLRSKMPMNIKKRLAGKPQPQEVLTNIARVEQLWSTCREQHGEKAGAQDAGFLFGTFGIADAMYAPVIWRFFTYNHVPADARARAYMATMLRHPLMREWEAAALAEDKGGEGVPGPIPHYDAASEELGGPARPEGSNTVEDFIAALEGKGK